jgi:hypothetical protein
VTAAALAWDLGDPPAEPNPRRVNLTKWRPPLVEAGAPFARFSLYMQVVHALPPLPEPMPPRTILRLIQAEARKIRMRRTQGSMSAVNILAASEGTRFEYLDGMWREKPSEDADG